MKVFIFNTKKEADEFVSFGYPTEQTFVGGGVHADVDTLAAAPVFQDEQGRFIVPDVPDIKSPKGEPVDYDLDSLKSRLFPAPENISR